MGIDPFTMFIASTVIQGISGFMEYREQKKADKAERAAYNASVGVAQEQAALDQADAERAAKYEQDEADRISRVQKMQYLASGVDLTGSPLLVMEETRAKGAENAKNVRDSAAARGNLAVRSAQANVPIARASLTGTIAKTASGVASSYNDYSLLKKQLA